MVGGMSRWVKWLDQVVGFSIIAVMHTLEVKTKSRDQMVEITRQIQRVVDHDGIENGAVNVFVPHTTAGITINENADPDVVHDFLKQLDEMVPWRQPFYQHDEGNSAAHVKASMMGSSVDRKSVV